MHELKAEKSFVTGLNDKLKNLCFIQTIIRLASNLELASAVEGLGPQSLLEELFRDGFSLE